MKIWSMKVIRLGGFPDVGWQAAEKPEGRREPLGLDLELHHQRIWQWQSVLVRHVMVKSMLELCSPGRSTLIAVKVVWRRMAPDWSQKYTYSKRLAGSR